MDCLFCKIVKREIPAHIVYEDGAAVGILDITPRAPGHTMVIPKAHGATILEVPDATITPLFGAVKKVTALLQKALAPDGFTIGINHGRASGQAVDHLHIHVIPRWLTDGGGSVHSVVNNPPQESLDTIKEKILKVAGDCGRGGFIQFPILAIIAILVIGAGVGAAVILHNQEITVPVPEGAEAQGGSATTTAVDAVPTTTRATTDYSSEEIEALRKEIEALKTAQKDSQQATSQTVPQPVPSQRFVAQNVDSNTDIVGNWRFFTAKLECPGSSNSSITYLGSGFITKGSDGNFKVLTNSHVVENSNFCNVRLLGNLTGIYHSSKIDIVSPSTALADFAAISLGNSDEYLKNLVAGDAYYGICKEEQKPILGDEIIVLGYPGIGSETDVTVTKGIISGFERIYFITDAKINHGNSGGVAINVKNNCYFGPPTYGRSDTETLGRILDVWKVMGRF